MIYRTTAGMAALVLAGASAFAADMPSGPPVYAPPVYAPAQAPPPYNWSGIYLGVNGGYGFAAATVSVAGFSATEDLGGFVGGGQFGANYQFGPAVIGIEADFDGSTQSYTVSGGAVTTTDKIPWLGTARVRIGGAFDRFLVYTTGGLGYGDFSSTVAAPGGSLTGSQSRLTWALGGGVEVGVTGGLSARVEYLYLDTGSIPLGSIAGFPVTGQVQDSLIRAGLNYRFSF
jgi:outer membrane immunogenic protein